MSKTVSITCRTVDAIIRYTTDGTGITEQSPIYSSPFAAEDGTIIMAKGFKDGLTPSDVASLEVGKPNTITDPSQILYAALTDGVVFYDRGEDYGDYNLTDGVLTRISAGMDDETKESTNWRYLIAQTSDLTDTAMSWCEASSVTGTTDSSIGAGLHNTNILVQRYGTNSDLPWYHVLAERMSTGKNWFIPSYTEAKNLAEVYDGIGDSDSWSSSYWTSTEYNSSEAYYVTISTGTISRTGKTNHIYNLRLIRRI